MGGRSVRQITPRKRWEPHFATFDLGASKTKILVRQSCFLKQGISICPLWKRYGNGEGRVGEEERAGGEETERVGDFFLSQL